MEVHGDDDGTTASRKPKRPLTAYNIFFKDKRQQILQQGSSGGFAALARNIAGMWKVVSPETKAHYLSKAAEDKQRYQREMTQWQDMAVTSSSPRKRASPDEKKQAMQVPRTSPCASVDRSPSVDQGNDNWELQHQPMVGRSSFDSGGSRSMYQNQETWMPLGSDDFPMTGVQRQQQHQPRLDEAQLLQRIQANPILDRRLFELSRQQPMASGVGMDTSMDLLLHQQQMRQRQEEQMMARAMQSQSQHHRLDVAGSDSTCTGNEHQSMATATTQQHQTYLPMPLPSQLDDFLFQRPISRTQHQQDQSSIFTPNSLRRVFDSDVDSVAALPSAEHEKPEEESSRLSFDEETKNLMARMMEQESDTDD